MTAKQRRAREKVIGSQLTEFSFVPLVMFLLAIPIIDLTGIVASYGYLAFSTFACANKASISPQFDSALKGMKDQAQQMLFSPMASFLKISPTGGYQACGCNLYIVNTDNDSHAIDRVGPNRAMSYAPNPAQISSEYEVVTSADVSPLIPIGLPFLKDIPMLGADTRLNVSWSKMAENQEGLTKAADSGATSGGTSSLSLHLDGIQNINYLTKFDRKLWRDPIIYEYLENQGVNIRDQDVLAVYAKTDDWTSSGFFIYPNYKVYVDYRATGAWRFGSGKTLLDADGAEVERDGLLYKRTGTPGDDGYMVVQFGNAQPMRIGSAKLIRPNGSGIMKLMAYDKDGNMNPATGAVADRAAYKDNTGRMMVRVIIVE